MGFAKTTASWISVLGGNSKVAKLDEDVVDTVDAMEQGIMRALARDEIQPEKAEARKRKMRVERSEDRLQYVLYDENQKKVLEARVTEQDIKVFASGADVKVSADLPAMTITHDKEKKNWKVASSYCENCTYRNPFHSCRKHGGQTLAYVRHAREEIGEGIALCMDVDVPTVGEDGQSDIWCPLINGSDNVRTELSSLRPKWSEKLKALCMDFKGSVEAASAKNFQLCLDSKAILVYGKKKDGSFCLEFENPLSLAQAFTISLTTMYWN